MPRPLVFSNGSLLVATDGSLNIRELFYPQVGQFDHLGGRMIRMGVWVNSKFAWMDEASWQHTLAYASGCLVSACKSTNTGLGVTLEIQDCVLPDQPVFLRQITVRNESHHPADVRVFFNHDLKIAESDTGLTAMYHPFSDSIIHFKGPFAFLFGGSAGKDGLYGYTTGVRRYGGEDGTMAEAPGGGLTMGPISQGAVDSTLSLRAEIAPGSDAQLDYWMVAGSSIREVTQTLAELKAKDLAIHFDSRQRQDQSTLTPIEARFEGLPEDLKTFCHQSYLILKTQIDSKGGILAANDSDIMIDNRAHYSYVWPRDGSLVAQVLDRLGDHETAGRYFEFCRGLETFDKGLFLQKYQPDGTFGATWHPWLTADGPEIPTQEDETALTVIALRDHLVATGQQRDDRWREFMQSLINGLMSHRDQETWLPKASHDLWEERRGLHAFTYATTVMALEAGVELLSDPTWDEDFVLEYAQQWRAEFFDNFVDEKSGVICRMIHPDFSPDTTPDASLLMLPLIGFIDIDDPRMQVTIKHLVKKLTVKSSVGGLARYPGDWYWRQGDAYPGNPWIITTMWLAQCQIKAAKSAAELREPLEWLRWAKRMAAPTGVLPEQFHPETSEHLSVSPLTWSHSEVLRTALDWCEKRKSFG